MARVRGLAGIAALVAGAAATGIYASSGLSRTHGDSASGATLAVQLEVTGWLLVLAGLAWVGRRNSPLAPMAPGLPPRILRVVGSVLILVFVALTVDDLHSRTAGTGDATNRAVFLAVCIVTMTIYAIAFLAISSRAASVDRAGLAVGTGIGLAVGLGWFAVALSRPTLPGDDNWAVPTVLVVAVLANLWANVRTGRAEQGWKAGLVAGITSALVIFVTTMVTFRLDGHRVPHIVDRAMLSGSTPAQKLAENRIEAPDFYIAVMLLGALLAAALIATIRMGRNRGAHGSHELAHEPLVLEG